MGPFCCLQSKDTKMQLHIRGNTNYVLEASNLVELKAKIAEVEGSEDVLLHVDVTVPLLGGKVHGSLARAGKVRGQTPKVEAQEKKKKKTGRAKRRIQYNRRFVNVVATFGRRRGPNANS